MKAIYCEICGTITSPGSEDNVPNSCECGTHRCWWADGRTGQFRVQYTACHPAVGKALGGAPTTKPEVWVIGVSNAFLHHDSSESPSAEDVRLMLAQTPGHYIFKKTNSLIIRIRPGQSGDTAWAVFEGPTKKDLLVESRIKNAVAEALKEERRLVCNYLYSIPGNGDLALGIDGLAHLKENDQT